LVHRLRAGCDAIAVGIGTAIADDPLLTVRGRGKPRIPPVRVIFDREARLPLASRLVRTAVQAPLLVVTNGSAPAREAALHEAGARVIRADGTASALRALRGEGITSLFAEGGAGVAGALLDAEAVDRLIIFRAPILLGGGALPAFSMARAAPLDDAPRLRLLRHRRLGEDEMTIYAMH
ncbi:MAG: RibD family protein, partial [Gemmatimonadaceae bacterium]|nr:RibD family protein [Gemmatimonadaceae bacterium]